MQADTHTYMHMYIHGNGLKINFLLTLIVIPRNNSTINVITHRRHKITCNHEITLIHVPTKQENTNKHTYTTTYMNVHTVYTSYIIAIINFVKII